jgi:hypothetical protein
MRIGPLDLWTFHGKSLTYPPDYSEFYEWRMELNPGEALEIDLRVVYFYSFSNVSILFLHLLLRVVSYNPILHGQANAIVL